MLGGAGKGELRLELQLIGHRQSCSGVAVEDVVDFPGAQAHKYESSELQDDVGDFHQLWPVHFVWVRIENECVVFEADCDGAVARVVMGGSWCCCEEPVLFLRMLLLRISWRVSCMWLRYNLRGT